MPKYRKKPVVIEAIQWKGSQESWVAIRAMGCTNTVPGEIGTDSFSIKTLEGLMLANLNDWIIKGVNGEFYPCKPDVFAKTYEKVEKTYEEVQGEPSDERTKELIEEMNMQPIQFYEPTGRQPFRKELQTLINMHSKENGSNTPDYILADFLNDCLEAYDKSVSTRDKWFGVDVWATDKKVKQ